MVPAMYGVRQPDPSASAKHLKKQEKPQAGTAQPDNDCERWRGPLGCLTGAEALGWRNRLRAADRRRPGHGLSNR